MSLSAAVTVARLLLQLAPEVRVAVESLVRALRVDDDAERDARVRRAVEAALRAAFVARQRR